MSPAHNERWQFGNLVEDKFGAGFLRILGMTIEYGLQPAQHPN